MMRAASRGGTAKTIVEPSRQHFVVHAVTQIYNNSLFDLSDPHRQNPLSFEKLSKQPAGGSVCAGCLRVPCIKCKGSADAASAVERVSGSRTNYNSSSRSPAILSAPVGVRCRTQVSKRGVPGVVTRTAKLNSWTLPARPAGAQAVRIRICT